MLIRKARDKIYAILSWSLHLVLASTSFGGSRGYARGRALSNVNANAVAMLLRVQYHRYAELSVCCLVMVSSSSSRVARSSVSSYHPSPLPAVFRSVHPHCMRLWRHLLFNHPLSDRAVRTCSSGAQILYYSATLAADPNLTLTDAEDFAFR